MTPPVTVSLPFFSSSTHRPSSFGLNLCERLLVLLSSIVSCPPSLTTITLPRWLSFWYFSTKPFKSSVTVRLTVRELLMLMSPVSLTVLTLESAIAAVKADSLPTSVTAPLAAGVSLPPINAIKAVSGWGSDTSFSGWGSDTSGTGCTAAASAGRAYLAQFSGKAPSAPQTGQSVFMPSAVQAVSQLHTGGVSVLSSAKAAVGIRHSSIHRASRVLTICFFILSPSLFAVR